MILIAAVLHCIWGIAAIDKANLFIRTSASSSPISAIGALLSIPGYPFWSLGVFFVDGQRRAHDESRGARAAL